MANVTPSAGYADVYQLETTDQALGGASGAMNRQAKALAGRTDYLKDAIEDLEDVVTTNKNLQDTLATLAAGHTTSIGTLNTFKTVAESDINALEILTAAHTASINSLITSVANLAGEIDDAVGVPTGCMVASPNWNNITFSTASWLKCNGDFKLIADYPDLFAALGSVASGASFQLPNVNNNFIKT